MSAAPGGPSNLRGAAGMTRVRAHLRLGKFVKQHQRHISKSSWSAYRKAAKTLGRRLYRIETSGGIGSKVARDALSKHLKGMLLSTPEQRAAYPEAKHYFTAKGWRDFGRKAFLKLRKEGYVLREPGTGRFKNLRIVHERGGFLLDRWQVLR